jgi:hypothetical protein
MRVARTFRADWPVRIPGDEHGDVEYAITRDEWEAARRGEAVESLPFIDAHTVDVAAERTNPPENCR